MEKIRTAVHEAAKDTLGDGKNPIKPWIRASTVRVFEERHRMERHRAQAAEENYKGTSGTGSKKRMTKHSETWFMVRNIGHDTKKGNTKECSNYRSIILLSTLARFSCPLSFKDWWTCWHDVYPKKKVDSKREEASGPNTTIVNGRSAGNWKMHLRLFCRLQKGLSPGVTWRPLGNSWKRWSQRQTTKSPAQSLRGSYGQCPIRGQNWRLVQNNNNKIKAMRPPLALLLLIILERAM